MGFMDLSTSVASKKHVDFNDARYQLADKLRQSNNKNTRSTFTLYDNKEYNKTSVQDISAAYELSDKRLPIGELLNKMVDMIIDVEDGVLDTEKDAVYAWKYSITLLTMYDDKSKRLDTLSMFDNGLKSSIVNSRLFIERYPGKYTNRTNFFDNKVKTSLMADIVATFKDVALPRIHDSAIKQSREAADRHNNPVLDKIVQWAVENYECSVDSFFESKEDIHTNLYFSVNTIILHLKNGYDISLVGYTGTDHDDKFAISILDANNISLKKHGERITQDGIQAAMAEAFDSDPVEPLTKLLGVEKKKNEVLKKQYEILYDIRPMIPADVLEIKAAESVVGQDYIWGCKQYRTNHEDLPAGFKLEDVELPVFDESEFGARETENQRLATDMASQMTTIMSGKTVDDNPKQEDHVINVDSAENDLHKSEMDTKIDADLSRIQNVDSGNTMDDQTHEINDLPKDDGAEDLFEIKKSTDQEKPLGGYGNADFGATKLDMSNVPEMQMLGKASKEFDVTSTLLPGIAPIKPKKSVEDNVHSITSQAQPAPKFDNDNSVEEMSLPNIKEPEQPKTTDEPLKQPELLLDDLDSLFS